MSLSLCNSIGIFYQALNPGGRPLNKGLIYSFAAGSTTPQATFADAAGTPNPNPIELQADGRVPSEIWLTDGLAYRLELRDSLNNVLKSQDNVGTAIGIAAPGGSALIGFQQAGIGAVQRTLQSKNRDVVSVKDFGAIGNGVADDTAAISAAFAYLASIPAWAFSASVAPRPALYFPAGIYNVSATLNVLFSGLHIFGDGPRNSIIAWTSAADVPVFDIGTFSATPADIFAGMQDTQFDDLYIQNTSTNTPLGARKAFAIRASGSGLVAHNLVCNGFKYGIALTYGCDFTDLDHVTLNSCDVGLYNGPGGQQFSARKLEVFGSIDGVVIDRPGASQFVKPLLSGCRNSTFKLESLTGTSTRFCSLIPATGTTFDSKIVLDCPEFEANPGGLGDDFIPANFIEHNSPVAPYRGIEVRSPSIISGTSGTKTPNAFFYCAPATTQVQFLHITYPVFAGGMGFWLFNQGTNCSLENLRVVTGYTPPALSNITANLLAKNNSGEDIIAGVLPFARTVADEANAFGIQTSYEVNGVLRFAFLNAGNYLYRFGFDIQNARLFFGDPAANKESISVGAAQPVAGTFTIGSFVFNTNPGVAAGKTLLGWQRLTTGSGHVAGTDWSPCFVTNS